MSDGVDRRRFLAAAGSAGAASVLSGVGGATGEPGRADREVVVGVGDATLDAVVGRLPADAEVVRRNPTLGHLVVRLPATSGYERLRTERRVATADGVKYTERNAEFRLHGVDDPRFEDQYAPQQVRAPAGWAALDGDGDPDSESEAPTDGRDFGDADDETVTVAVVDQGVMYDHPDLVDAFGDPVGRDFGDGDDDPYPSPPEEEYHGTHVAGIVAATADDRGIAGVAGGVDVRLLSCRIAGSDGRTYAARTAEAVQWAADQGADLVNMSLGHPEFGSRAMRDAVAYAENAGTLCLASTGNDYAEEVSYPARLPEVVGVAAVDDRERHAAFANTGPGVDVTGPGVDVLSCFTREPYTRASGTSMSCPAATGVAAMARAANPDLSVVGLRLALTEGAVDIGLEDHQQGAGRVDAPGAVAAARDSDRENRPPVAAFSTSETTAAVGESVRFDATDARDHDGSIDAYEWRFGDGTAGRGRVVEHAFDDPGAYTVTLRVVDDEGEATTLSTTLGVRVDPADSCGAQRETDTRNGHVRWQWGSRLYEYDFHTRDPCRIAVSLSGPGDADFDLYLTTDGRYPSTEDYDRASRTPGSEERIELGDLSGVTSLGVLVVAASGSGSFDLTVEELGR